MKHPNSYYLTEQNAELEDYFNFGLSVDCVVFGYHEGEVNVLLVERNEEPYKGAWALVGDLVHPQSDLAAAASAILSNLTGLSGIFMEQFFTFDAIDRHPLGRVVTVGYYSLVESTNYQPVASSWAKSTRWFSIKDLPELAFDHQLILDKGIQTLKRRVRYRPVGFELLPQKFTLADLQALYEALLGRVFDKPNFRKKILRMNFLTPLDEFEENVWHRPAKLYSFDEERYNALRKEGFAFEL
ncbi:MAG: NUDIX hydrolase [Bacteroidota bacterium]|nr:NUDIX hydrolase [Bacteroidota bacterium]MDX5430744.1 NUDIX hydrolase [Bacteroidota bacterium]MDX5469491.1 NUDIX hydrolase [Bacteroidota bacterium]